MLLFYLLHCLRLLFFLFCYFIILTCIIRQKILKKACWFQLMWLIFSCANISPCSATGPALLCLNYFVLTTWEPGTAEELFVYGSLSIRVDIPCSRVSIVCWCGSVPRKHCRKLDNESRSTPSSSVHVWERKMIVCKANHHIFEDGINIVKSSWIAPCTCFVAILNTFKLLKFIFLKNNMCK